MPTTEQSVNFDMLRWVRDARAAGLSRERVRAILNVGVCTCSDCRRDNTTGVRRERGYRMGRCRACDGILVHNPSGSWRVQDAGEGHMSCSGCGYCAGCCECIHCDRCSEPVTSTCDNCEGCRECCRCAQCRECGVRVDSDRRCRTCRRCDDCECSCGASVDFFEPSEPRFHAPGVGQTRANGSRRFLSAEIEVAGITEDDGVTNTVRKWGGAIVEDGSLPSEGFEINTAPAGGDLWVKEVTDICGALKRSGARVTSSCGTHVHIDARDLRFLEMRRLLKLYASFESVFFGMVPQNRRDSHYCQPCGDRYRKTFAKVEGAEPRKRYRRIREEMNMTIYNATDRYAKRAKRNKYHHSRYNALNVHSWYYRGTVECRLLNGTVDADTIVAWGMLWARLVDAAATMSDSEVDAVDTATTRQRSPGRSSGQAYDEFMRVVVAGDKRLRDFVNNRLMSNADGVLLARASADQKDASKAA